MTPRHYTIHRIHNPGLISQTLKGTRPCNMQDPEGMLHDTAPSRGEIQVALNSKVFFYAEMEKTWGLKVGNKKENLLNITLGRMNIRTSKNTQIGKWKTCLLKWVTDTVRQMVAPNWCPWRPEECQGQPSIYVLQRTRAEGREATGTGSDRTEERDERETRWDRERWREGWEAVGSKDGDDGRWVERNR